MCRKNSKLIEFCRNSSYTLHFSNLLYIMWVIKQTHFEIQFLTFDFIEISSLDFETLWVRNSPFFNHYTLIESL